MELKWDEWVGSLDGRPTMLTKFLFKRPWLQVALHKFVSADDPGCFHTHPASAIRIILCGGYVEHLHGDSAVRHQALWRYWRPGMVGIVAPTLCHRIDELLNGQVSYSLWIRFRKTHQIDLRGGGWEAQRKAKVS